MTLRTFTVVGKPKPQGSVRTLLPLRGSKPVTLASDPGVYVYRADIQAGFMREFPGMKPEAGPMVLHCTFVFERPKTHYWPVNRRHAEGELRPTAPVFYPSTPDLDKLLRAVGDALSGFAYYDDKQVVQMHGSKVYGDTSYTLIDVLTMDDHEKET